LIFIAASASDDNELACSSEDNKFIMMIIMQLLLVAIIRIPVLISFPMEILITGGSHLDLLKENGVSTTS